MIIPKEKDFHTTTVSDERILKQILLCNKQYYNSTKVGKDFKEPFFKALGWDMDNSIGVAESNKEVIHEDRVKIGKASKAPVYSSGFKKTLITIYQ